MPLRDDIVQSIAFVIRRQPLPKRSRKNWHETFEDPAYALAAEAIVRHLELSGVYFYKRVRSTQHAWPPVPITERGPGEWHPPAGPLQRPTWPGAAVGSREPEDPARDGDS